SSLTTAMQQHSAASSTLPTTVERPIRSNQLLHLAIPIKKLPEPQKCWVHCCYRPSDGFFVIPVFFRSGNNGKIRRPASSSSSQANTADGFPPSIWGRTVADGDDVAAY
ncbi:hypothetical protein ACLOJK_023231, partial [Asimina triloba]